jgi:hypothetical protein
MTTAILTTIAVLAIGLMAVARWYSTADKQHAQRVAATLRSDANPGGRYQLQPFGGRILGHGEQQGFRVPTQVEIGNGFGRPDFQPFFRAWITSLHYGPD